MLSYEDNYNPDVLDWGDTFDDLDAAAWEDYLGGPDEDDFEDYGDCSIDDDGCLP